MQKLMLWTCVWLCGAGALLAGEAGQTIATVNVSLVFENYKRVPDIQRAMDVKFKTRQQALDQRSVDLNTRSNQLQQHLGQGVQTMEVFDEVQRLRREQFTFKTELDRLNEQMQQELTKEMRAVLTDIRVAIRQVAERSGYRLVFRSSDSDDPAIVDEARLADPTIGDEHTLLALHQPKTAEELLSRFHRNPVLFGAQPTDITQQVLVRLNDEYAKRFIRPDAPGRPGNR